MRPLGWCESTNLGPKGQSSVRDIERKDGYRRLSEWANFESRVGVVYRTARLAQILSAGLSLRMLRLGCRGYGLDDLFTVLQSRLNRQGGYLSFLFTSKVMLAPPGIRMDS